MAGKSKTVTHKILWPKVCICQCTATCTGRFSGFSWGGQLTGITNDTHYCERLLLTSGSSTGFGGVHCLEVKQFCILLLKGSDQFMCVDFVWTASSVHWTSTISQKPMMKGCLLKCFSQIQQSKSWKKFVWCWLPHVLIGFYFVYILLFFSLYFCINKVYFHKSSSLITPCMLDKGGPQSIVLVFIVHRSKHLR